MPKMDLSVTTLVDAPPEQVWRLFTDVERWPEMIASVREARRIGTGPMRVGSEFIIKQPRLRRARWRVTELEPGRSFAWTTTSGGVSGDGGHIVEPNGQGSKITITLRVYGPLAWLVYPFIGRLSQRYITMEMEGFRRTAESARTRVTGRREGS